MRDDGREEREGEKRCSGQLKIGEKNKKGMREKENR